MPNFSECRQYSNTGSPSLRIMDAQSLVWNTLSSGLPGSNVLFCECCRGASPEIVQSLPYGEGADIWSLGCVLYQMCAHHPPFQAECILTVASRIVKSEFEPLAKICQYPYSDLVEKVVQACLTADPTKRPDIVGVAGHLTDQLLQQLDSSRQTTAQAKRRLKEFRDQFNLGCSLGSMNQSLSHSFGLATSKLDSRCNSMIDCFGSMQLGQVGSDTDIQADKSTNAGKSSSHVMDQPMIQGVDNLSDALTSRLSSSTARVTIAQRRLRPIDDPILDIVKVVHKLGRLQVINQNNNVATTKHRILYNLVNGYTRQLFSVSIQPMAVKHELFQLARRSPQPVNYTFIPSNVEVDQAENAPSEGMLTHILKAIADDDEMPSFTESTSVTYEILMAAIDLLFRECTEYTCTSQTTG
ncbi:hypothetical protein PHET_04352 [Paragonimus heterotremus]|uniref:Protein kinase domain-containing protein n=1 Tax=Paragonimus heterotremus TaxID=100268 RepID=A0A8J4SZJ0_9TREM|nr:hypothetical protein PHET_04352 [Paragonimus heterotremus]